MENGEVELIGSIDQIMPDAVSSHDNEVEIANITEPELIDLKYEDKEVLCVFKPFAGENERTKTENGDSSIKEYFPREYFAFSVSDHFEFDIIPPTITRTIDDRVGALQLLIDKDHYISQQKIIEKYPEVDEEQWDALAQSKDFSKMLLLDFILLNCDRNPGNYLVKINRSNDGGLLPGVKDDPNENSLIAIDHGLCMSSSLYFKVRGIKDGPIKMFTQTKDNVKIPDDLMGLLKTAYEDRSSFSADLIDEEISPDEVNYMWQRVNMLIKSGIFLSKYNIKNHYDTLKEELKDHPQLFISA